MSHPLEKRVASFLQTHGIAAGKMARVLDLASETGEVCKLAFSESTGKVIEPEKWQDELGDVLFSLLALMSELGISAEDALHSVIQKYEKRLKNSGRMDSGR